MLFCDILTTSMITTMIKINSQHLNSIINGNAFKSQNTESDLTTIHQLLNCAIQIEHFTIPLYLIAYYSIPEEKKSEKNEGLGLLSQSLREIYMDEMHHMKWACNLLTAYNGTPQVHCKENMPDYPNGPSILHIENEFPLSKASLQQIKKFVEIEKPDFDPLEVNEKLKGTELSSEKLIHKLNNVGSSPKDIQQVFKNVENTLTGKLGGNAETKIITYLIHVATELIEHNPAIAELLIKKIISSNSTFTIGQFYHIVKFYILLHKKKNPDFEFNTKKQIVKKGVEILVKTAADAVKVIDEIVEQGEGTSTSPVTGKDLAHYYKFNEIVHQRKAVVKDGKVSYEGEPIKYDENELYPFSENLKLSDLLEDSAEYKILQNFNNHYNEMLQKIENAYTTGDSSLIDQSIQIMRCLSSMSKGIVTMSNPNNKKENLRPVFEYSTL